MQSSSAIRMWVRSHIRRDWRALALIAVSVALAGGFTMTAAIGAHRAGSAWSQFLDRTRVADLGTELPTADTATTIDELRTEPGVSGAWRMAYMAVGPESYNASATEPTAGFAGLTPGFGTDVYRPIIVAGRAADPTRADEFTINVDMAHATGLRPGDQVTLASRSGAVRQPATVVGIHVAPFDVGTNVGSSSALFTPAFGMKWFETYFAALDAGTQSSYHDVVMVDADSAAARIDLLSHGYVPGPSFSGDQAAAGLDAVRTAYEVLALLAAIGSAVAIGQVISRRIRRHAGDTPTLAALGLGPSERRVALAASHLLAGIAGMALAPFVAYVASSLTSRGLVRLVDPTGDHVTDPLVLVGGSVVGIVVIGAVAIYSASRADRRLGAPAVRVHRSGVALPGPAGLFGGRVAAGWSHRSDRAVAGTHVAAVAVGTAAVVAVLMWSSAARHVGATPSLYGATFDAAVGPSQNFPDDPRPLLDALAEKLVADPSVGIALSEAVAEMVPTPSGRIELVQFDPRAGNWQPALLSGRRATGPHEITVGAKASAQLGQGDVVDIAGQPFTIVGEHVVPTFSQGEFGLTAVAPAGAVPIDLSYNPSATLLVDLADGSTLDRLQSLAGPDLVVQGADAARPGSVVNLGKIGWLDELLLAVCLVLTFASLANGLALATRARRRDHATLRALGAGRSTIAGTVRWHAAIVAGFGAAIGIPLGLIVGAAVWRRTAHGIGIAGALRRPAEVALIVLAVVLIEGAAVAWVEGAAASRQSRRRSNAE